MRKGVRAPRFRLPPLNLGGPDVVYTGSSISLREAQKACRTGTTIYPPIARGSLEELMATSPEPGNVLIIDGVFFSTQSVSLTEIGTLLTRGWRVFGASSLGAIRAVEAGVLGMVGLGSVFRWLRTFSVEDDDEVAQLINSETFEALTPAMVDLRAFIQSLYRNGILRASERKEVIQKIKSYFFPERTYQTLYALLPDRLSDAELATVKRMTLEFEGPKRQDAFHALEVLKRLRENSKGAGVG